MCIRDRITTDGFVGYDMLIREGEELSSFYGYKRAGIYDGIPVSYTHLDVYKRQVICRDNIRIGMSEF